MVLSSSQHILLAVSLALCLCFLVPRMIGGDVGKNEPKKGAPPVRGHSHKENRMHGSQRGFNPADHIKNAMEHELKSEKAGESRSMAFTLMPLYAVGVAIFAAYKFTKIKSKESSSSKSEEDDKKSKQTESQLLELERHLSQTEQMLNSILTQLDPLSTCVNTLAVDQKNEIMSQLQSIRQLMKKSGMEKVNLDNPDKQTCDSTLEDLINSFETQQTEVNKNNVENEESPNMEDTDITAHKPGAEESPASVDLCEGEDGHHDGADDTSPISEGLRKRNV